jgi:hypothetical protein
LINSSAGILPAVPGACPELAEGASRPRRGGQDARRTPAPTPAPLSGRNHSKKLWGRSSRPLCRCLLQVLSAFCCFSSLLSFWLPWIYSPFPLFMEFRNDDLLQLVECIESTQNEVKRKMIEAGACNAVPKSPAPLTREKKHRHPNSLSDFLPRGVGRSSKALVQIDFQNHSFQLLLRLIALRLDVGDLLAQSREAVLLRVELRSIALD